MNCPSTSSKSLKHGSFDHDFSMDLRKSPGPLKEFKPLGPFTPLLGSCDNVTLEVMTVMGVPGFLG